MGRGSIQLARIFGIRIGLDPSWFIALFLFIVLLAGPFDRTVDASETVAYATAVASALLFFTSLLLHELGHALMARRLGIEIVGIDLFLFGGVAKMRRDTSSPGAEFKVAIAGPVVTLVIAATCLGLALALSDVETTLDAVALSEIDAVTPALALLGWLTWMNAALFAFNVMPAFPLDGGRVVRALVWWRTGDRGRATRAAATLGRGFAWLLIGLGIAQLAWLGGFGGVWLIILGVFLGQSAKQAIVQSTFTDRLEGVTVADVMDAEPVSVPAGATAAQALDDWFLRYRWSWFPVVDADGRFVGLVREERVRGAVSAGDEALPVGELVDGDPAAQRVNAEEPIEALLGSETLRRDGALMAVDALGRLVGVITIEQVGRAVAAAAQPLRLGDA